MCELMVHGRRGRPRLGTGAVDIDILRLVELAGF
jgi:hypothetical protein